MSKKVLNIKQLSDGTGRVCTHWLVSDPDGPIKTVGSVRAPTPQEASQGQRLVGLRMDEQRWRMACNPLVNTINPQTINGETYICSVTNELRATTCPKCLDSADALTHGDKILAIEREQAEKSAKVVADAQAAHEASLRQVPQLIPEGVP